MKKLKNNRLFATFFLLIANINLFSMYNYESTSTLWEGVQDNDLIKVQFAIETGANVNDQTATGTTPLHFATRRFSKDIVQFLISHGATVNQQDKKGNTPFFAGINEICETVCYCMANEESYNHKYVSKGLQTLDVLMDNGADANLKNYAGSCTLSQAVKHSCLPVFLFLMNVKDINVNTFNQSGTTPLIFAAAEKGNKSDIIFHKLIEAGANPTSINYNDETPLSIVVQNGSVEKLKDLIWTRQLFPSAITSQIVALQEKRDSVGLSENENIILKMLQRSL